MVIVLERISPKLYDYWPLIRAQATTPAHLVAKGRPEDHDRQADEHDREQSQTGEHQVLPVGARPLPSKASVAVYANKPMAKGKPRKAKNPAVCGARSPASVRSSTHVGAILSIFRAAPTEQGGVERGQERTAPRLRKAISLAGTSRPSRTSGTGCSLTDP